MHNIEPNNYKEEQSDIQIPNWIESEGLKVIFTPRSLNGLENVLLTPKFTDKNDLRQAIVDVLQEDPRSNYRRDKCSDKLYYFNIDNVKITCWFDEDTAEVLKVASHWVNAMKYNFLWGHDWG